jgi:hypothetical protein
MGQMLGNTKIAEQEVLSLRPLSGFLGQGSFIVLPSCLTIIYALRDHYGLTAKEN